MNPDVLVKKKTGLNSIVEIPFMSESNQTLETWAQIQESTTIQGKNNETCDPN